MVIVIIAGGAGTRLWPLSQANYPKHLLRLTGRQSLLQKTFRRAESITDQIYIVTEASHAGEVKRQLPKLPQSHVIIEPARRGTASCIMLALASLKKKYPEQAIVFLHADHHITDNKGFTKTVWAAAKASQTYQKICLIGLQPSHPATGLGYIKVASEAGVLEDLPVLEVEKFVEKPNYNLARKYTESGEYLWNMGLFAAPVKVFESNFKRYAKNLHLGYQQLLKKIDKKSELEVAYLGLKNLPIDTALMERTPDLLIVPGRFDWADIGSFFDLHKILQGKDKNTLRGDVHLIDCEDSMIHGSTKPILAVGLSGVIVVDTPDGLLVCAKEQSQRVKEALELYDRKKAQTKRPAKGRQV